MLKASELKTGNLVWELNEETKEPFEIKGIQKLSNKDYLMDSNGDWCGLEFYLPIPLTEDWLLKFGFEKGEENAFDFCIKYNIDYDCWFVVDFSDGWLISKWSKKPHFKATDKDFQIITNLKHVHQLQNLYFALTQKELEC